MFFYDVIVGGAVLLHVAVRLCSFVPVLEE